MYNFRSDAESRMRKISTNSKKTKLAEIPNYSELEIGADPEERFSQTAQSVRKSFVSKLSLGLGPYKEVNFDFCQNLIRTSSGDFEQVSEDF